MPTDRPRIPQTLKDSAPKIEDTYKETLASAEQEYGGDEARAHRVAWGSVKNVAEKVGDHWELKDETGPSDERSKKPAAAKRRGEGETFGGVNVEGNTLEQLRARARQAGIPGRSKMNKAELGRALARREHD